MFKFIKDRIKEVYQCRMRGHNYVIVGQNIYPAFLSPPITVNILVCCDCGISKEEAIYDNKPRLGVAKSIQAVVHKK